MYQVKDQVKDKLKDQVKDKVTVLFDFDGVIMDTEPQYTLFWNKQGVRFLGENDFGYRIKGQTMAQIYNKYFSGKEEAQETINEELEFFEKNMSYEYVPGITAFIEDLKRNEVNVAVVTSSNSEKMEKVYAAHPEFPSMVDRILTGEMFARSKPAPDCFLLGMELFGATPQETYVFEDSFHGLKAGMDSGATVFGLATTNSREAIAEKAHYIIDDFRDLSYEKMISFDR